MCKNKNGNNMNNTRIHNNNKETIQITTLERTVTSVFTVVGKLSDRHMDGPIRCSSLTLQRGENQREHGKL
jgi:hypothetical protein